MPEQKLNRTQVGARLEEVDGECVAERMWRNRLGEARASGGEPAGIPDRFRRDRLLRALAGKYTSPEIVHNVSPWRLSTYRTSPLGA